jgi:hypothetical protein
MAKSVYFRTATHKALPRPTQFRSEPMNAFLKTMLRPLASLALASLMVCVAHAEELAPAHKKMAKKHVAVTATAEAKPEVPDVGKHGVDAQGRAIEAPGGKVQRPGPTPLPPVPPRMPGDDLKKMPKAISP